MTGLLRRLRSALRARPPVAAGGGGQRTPAKRRGTRRPIRLQATDAARLEALIAARFEALDRAMAARAEAQLRTLAQLIGEAIVAECRGLRQPAAGRAGKRTRAQPPAASGGPSSTPS